MRNCLFHCLSVCCANRAFPWFSIVSYDLIVVSLIRLEFNSTHLHYYMELDAVCLYGTLEDIEEDPGNPGTEGIQKIAACAEDETKDAELPSRLSELHINETDESYSESGLFDKMPVSHYYECFAIVITIVIVIIMIMNIQELYFVR